MFSDGQKYLIYMKSNLSISLLLLMFLVSNLRIHCQVLDHEDLPLCFLLIVLDLIFKLLIYLNFDMRCKVGIQLHFFECGYSVVPISFIEKTILSPTK